MADRVVDIQWRAKLFGHPFSAKNRITLLKLIRNELSFFEKLEGLVNDVIRRFEKKCTWNSKKK